MAQQNVIVRLSLKDQEVVRRGLEALGADGEKALKRIDAAGRAPSAGLKALGAASDEVRGSLGNLAGSAGTAGTALQALGPGGLMAAAGLGAALLVLGKLVSAAREAGEFFAKLGDDAERAGTSASKLATVQGVFIANAASADEANSALVRLRATIDDAMSGVEKAQTAFQNVGISMQWLAQNGGDTVDVLMKIAQHGGLTAGQLNDLTGKIGNALVPAMQELAKVGVQSNQEFDALTKQINESKDKIELLDRQMTALSMGGSKVFLEGVAQIKAGLVDLTGWFLRTAEANATLWKRLGQASMKDWLWGDPIKDALNERDQAAEQIKKQQEEFKSIVAGQVKIEQTLRHTPAPYTGSISSGGGSKKKTGGGRQRGPEYVDIVTGAPHTPTEEELYLLAHKPVARPVGGLDAFLDDADKIEKRNDDLMTSLQRAWLQASNQRIALINLDRDTHLKALEDEELSEEQLALARLTINETAEKQIADAQLDLVKTTDKAKDSTLDLTDTFQGFGQVASSAFEDAIVKGEKFSDVLNGLAEDIQRLAIRNTMNKLFDIGMKAGTNLVSSWFGASASGPSTPGTPVTGGPATYDAAGWDAWLAGSAHGNAFYGGNVIPFARGGVVHRPTLFPMARGTGLMGEAGPEAVMPLKRLPSGDLGVKAAGGPGVVVNVINNAGAKVSTEESRDSNGRMNINVVIDAVEQAMAQRASRPGTTLNRALATASNPVRAR